LRMEAFRCRCVARIFAGAVSRPSLLNLPGW
jgi:hypothetical protein